MRKILSFVLVLSLVLGSFSMAFAATPTASASGLSDIAGIANEDAIQVANDLGVVTGNPDGTYQPEKAVNRAEFAAMITRALAIPDSALAGYKTSKFKDTSGYGWAVPYLAFCDSKGIILGDGSGNAMPGRTISGNEAMTMALRAIGYTANSSELVGAWPSNYVSIAQNNKLYEDVVKDATGVDKANAAQIIYNLLTVQKVAVNTDGQTTYLEIDNPNYVKDDDVNGNKKIAATLINTGLNCTQEDNEIITGADYNNTLINVTKYMGAHGTKYINDDGDIVAFTLKDSTALTGEMDGNDFKVGDVKYSISSKAEKDSNPIAIQNTVEKKFTSNLSTIKDKIQSMDNTYTDDKVIINADVSGKTINKVYSVVGWQATEADQVDATDLEDLNDNELLGVDFDEDNNGDIDTASFALKGVASLDKIAKDNVVYIYQDDTSDKYIRMVAVGTTVVEGTASELDGTDVYIDGKVYEQATFSSTASIKADKEPKVGDGAKLSLDAFGKYFKVDKVSGTPDKFGIVKVFTGAAGVDNAKAKIYTSDDTTKTFTFADWNDDDIDVTGALPVKLTTPSLIGYDVDTDGDIDTLDVTETNGTSGAVQVRSSKVLQDGNTYYDIAEDVVVFTYDTTGAGVILEDKFDVASIGDIDTGDILNPAGATGSAFRYIYDVDAEEVTAIMVCEAFTDNNSNDIFGVFNTVTSIKDGSDKLQKATGFVDGKEYTQTTTDDNSIKDYNNTFGKIGLYQMEINGTKEIKIAKRIINNSDKTEASIEANGEIVTDVNSGKTVLSLAGNKKVTAESNAIVYKAKMKSNNKEVDYYEVSKLSSIKKNSMVWMYDTKDGSDHDGIATVIIFTDDYGDPDTNATIAPTYSTSGGAITPSGVNLEASTDAAVKVQVALSGLTNVNVDKTTYKITATNKAGDVVGTPSTTNSISIAAPGKAETITVKVEVSVVRAGFGDKLVTKSFTIEYK